MNNEERDAMLQRIDERTNRMDKRLEVMENVSTRHDHSLYGNGRPGLCQRVDQMEIQQSQCPGRINASAPVVSNRIAAGALIVAILAAIMTIIGRLL